MTPEQRYLTVKEAAEYLGFKPSAIYHWVSEGKIPYIKKFRSVRFDKTTLDRFMQRDKITLQKGAENGVDI